MVFFHRDHLLLRHKTVPAAERLGVLPVVGIVGSHVAAHDGGGVFGDVQAGFEAVLQTHPLNELGIDGMPAFAMFLLKGTGCLNACLIVSHDDLQYFDFFLI